MISRKTAYEQMTTRNEAKRDYFVLHGKPGNELTLLEPIKPNVLVGDAPLDSHQTKATTLTKTALQQYGDGSSVHLINEDNEFHSLAVTTTAATHKKLLRNGLIPENQVQSPLAKMIVRVGEYKRLAFERAYHEETVIEKHDERMAIADTAQDFYEALQGLQCCINHYREDQSEQQNLDHVKQELNRLQNKLDIIQNRFPPDKLGEKPYPLLVAGIARLKDQVSAYEATLSNASLTPVNEATVRSVLAPFNAVKLNPADDFSLQHFLQNQVNDMSSLVRQANNNLTGLYQDTSGLDVCLLEAKYVAEDYSSKHTDLKNAVTAAHNFDFSDNANPDELITYQLTTKPDDQAALAETVAHIDSVVGGVDVTQTGKLHIKSGARIRFTDTPITSAAKAVTRWFIEGLAQTAGIIADLGTLGNRVFTEKSADGKTPPESVSGGEYINNRKNALLKSLHLEAEHGKTNSAAAQQILTGNVTKVRFQGMAKRFIDGAKRLAQNWVIGPVVDTVTQSARNIARTIGQTVDDMRYGSETVTNKEIAELLKQRLQECDAQYRRNENQMDAVTRNYNESLPDNAPAKKIHHGQLEIDMMSKPRLREAVPAYNLHMDKGPDAVSWLLGEFYCDITGVFAKEIYRSHPISSLAFTAAMSTTAPMMFPVLAHTAIAQPFLAVSDAIGKTIAGGTTGLSAVVSTGLVEGKLAFLAADLFTGRDSLFARLMEIVLKNPLPAAGIGCVAIATGMFIAEHQSLLPVIGSEAADVAENATFPYFELSLVGAKVIALAVEGSLNLEQEPKERLQHQVNSLLNDPAQRQRITDEFTQLVKFRNVSDAEIKSYLQDPAHNTALETRFNQKAEELHKEILDTEQRTQAINAFRQSPAGVRLKNEITQILHSEYKVQYYNAHHNNQLTPEHQDEVLHYVKQYCNNMVQLVTNPSADFKERIQTFAETLKDEMRQNPAVTPSIPTANQAPAAPNPYFEEAQHNRERQDIRDDIARIDPKVFSNTDKSRIERNLLQQYPDNLDYVSSVMHHLRDEKPAGPVAESAKMALTYPFKAARAGIAGLRGLYQEYVKGDKAKAKVAYAQGKLFLREAAGDIGLVVKSVANALRSTWSLVGSPVMTPAAVSIGRLAGQSLSDGDRIVDKALFAPGIISQGLDNLTGSMRQYANSMNLDEANKRLAQQENAILSARMKAAAGISHSISLDTTSPTDLLRNALNQHTALAAKIGLTHRQTFTDIVDALQNKLVISDNAIAFRGVNQALLSHADRQVCLQALYQVHEALNKPEQQTARLQIDKLIEAHRPNPVTETLKAFAPVMKTLGATLPALPDSALKEELTDAFNALKKLGQYQAQEDYSNDPATIASQREMRVINLLREHRCLTVIQTESDLRTLQADRRDFKKNHNTADYQEATQLQKIKQVILASANHLSHALAAYDNVTICLTTPTALLDMSLPAQPAEATAAVFPYEPPDIPVVDNGIPAPNAPLTMPNHPTETPARNDAIPNIGPSPDTMPALRFTRSAPLPTPNRLPPEIRTPLQDYKPLAGVVMHALQTCQHDRCSREIINALGVVSLQRGTNQNPVYQLNKTWQTLLEQHDSVRASSLTVNDYATHLTTPCTRVPTGWTMKAADKQFTEGAITPTPTQAIYENAALESRFDVKKTTSNQFDFTMQNKPPHNDDAKTEKAVADMIEQFVKHNGMDAELNIDGAEEALIKTAIKICRANDIKCAFDKRYPEPSAAEVSAAKRQYLLDIPRFEPMQPGRSSIIAGPAGKPPETSTRITTATLTTIAKTLQEKPLQAAAPMQQTLTTHNNSNNRSRI